MRKEQKATKATFGCRSDFRWYVDSSEKVINSSELFVNNSKKIVNSGELFMNSSELFVNRLLYLPNTA